MIKLPKTVIDQIMLCIVLVFLGCSSAMISLVIQQKPIPPDFKEFTENLGIGVISALSVNELSK